MMTVKWTQPKPCALESLIPSCMHAWNERWESSPRGRTTYEYFPDVRNRSRMNWIQPNHQVTQLLSGHGNFRAYLRRFAIQEDDTCDCDVQESKTVLHLVNDCPHHIEERRSLSVAAARAGVEWPPALVFWVQRTIFTLFLTFAKSVQDKKTQAAQAR